MKLSVSAEAAKWYETALHLQNGDWLRLFVQYGGCSTVQAGLSLGIRKDDPRQPAAETDCSGITFFVEQDDEWYFDGHDLSIVYHAGSEAPEFLYHKEKQ